MAFSITLRRRSWLRLGGAVGFFLFVRWLMFPSTPSNEIAHHNVIERVARVGDKTLDVQKYPFLQRRIGRDEEPDILSDFVDDGTKYFWERFQLPFMTSRETTHIDAQAVRSAIEDLLALNGWVAAACPTLNRPFGQNKREDAYDDLADANRLYYIAIVIHSADHFLVDQLATIVQLARRLGTRNIFVSMLDYDSRDSTPTLTDLSEAVLTLLGIPFRIKRVSILTEEESAGYYPLEEAYTRNLALEPLHELQERRKIHFDKVIWLKGFTCPNDVLENIKVSQVNHAAMTCGMDWAENNGFFIFSDRWRTRDMDGDQFKVSRSSSPNAPPREEVAAKRYAEHLPFQVFCCESGTHIVDPAQTYYRGIQYRYSSNFHNVSTAQPPPQWDPYGECMDSSQAWFCRDIWVESARAGLGVADQPVKPEKLTNIGKTGDKRQDDAAAPPNPPPAPDDAELPDPRQREGDANAGSDYDKVPDKSPPPLTDSQTSFAVPNSNFEPARIIINPRCVTTYAGVSHTQLAGDLFGLDRDDDIVEYDKQKYVLEEWKTAPGSYVCQEQRYTGGRKAPKNQRSSPFSIHEELHPNVLT